MFNDYSKVGSKTKHRSIHGDELKISISKQVLQRLSIAFAQVKAGNTSENLLNETCQIIHSLYHAKGNTKKTLQLLD